MRKYKICWDVYNREGGQIKTASFSATDDFDALKKVVEHCNTYLNEDEFFDSKEEAIAAGYDEGELEDLYIRDVTDVEKIVNDLMDSDGADFIFYIKRPDESYLLESGEEPSDEDWDD